MTSKRPLSVISILVTFDDPDRSLELKLASQGANVKFDPLIQVQLECAGPPKFPLGSVAPAQSVNAVDGLLPRLSAFSTIVFFSKTAVRTFFEGVEFSKFELSRDVLNWIAMGTGTQLELNKYGVENVSLPSKSDSEGLAQFLVLQNWSQPILLLRASNGSPIVPNRLADAGIEFEQVPIYQTIERELSTETIKRVASGDFDWITIASSSLAQYAANQLGDNLRGVKIASISPTTSAKIRELGFEVAAEAESFDYDGIVAAIARSCS